MACYLIGASGRLGRAIANEFVSSDVIMMRRDQYADWVHAGAADLVSRFFESRSQEGDTIFVTSGLLDPRLPKEKLFGVNYLLPKNVIDGATKHGVKVVTFGSVLEGFLAFKNPYIQSKTALAEYIGSVVGDVKPVIHIQIHTLYGRGQPSPFMFLGQVLSSLRMNQTFNMTSGRQLREYHHLDDEAKAIRKIISSETVGVINLSHGQPLTLRTIAENIFEAHGKSHLLKIGTLPEPPEENYDRILKPLGLINEISFRDSLSSITQYIQECYCKSEAGV